MYYNEHSFKNTKGHETGMNVLIRQMRWEDIPAIVEGELRQGWHPSEEKYKIRMNDMEAGRSTALVAEVDGRAVGYLNVYWHEVPELVDFGVLESHRRQGIGSQLMDKAEQLAFSAADTVCLSVGLHSGYGSAQRMYVKRGYLPDGAGAYYEDTVAAPYQSYPLDDSLVLRLYKTKPTEVSDS